MQNVSPEIYSRAFQQLVTASTLLGGFSFTMAAVFVGFGAGRSNERSLGIAGKVTAISALVSAVCFVNASLIWSLMSVETITLAAKEQMASSAELNLHWYSTQAFRAGVVFIFLSLGASGWIESRIMGALTSSVSIIGAICSFYIFSHFIS